jgi:hypothetical protein
MPLPAWKTAAVAALKRGEPISIRPTGNSMQGILEPGTPITLLPASNHPLRIGDIVLAELPRKHRIIPVLHKIWDIRETEFLIGNAVGRMDGWIPRANILGILQVL